MFKEIKFHLLDSSCTRFKDAKVFQSVYFLADLFEHVSCCNGKYNDVGQTETQSKMFSAPRAVFDFVLHFPHRANVQLRILIVKTAINEIEGFHFNTEQADLVLVSAMYWSSL